MIAKSNKKNFQVSQFLQLIDVYGGGRPREMFFACCFFFFTILRITNINKQDNFFTNKQNEIWHNN